MTTLKQIVSKIPGLPSVYRMVRQRYLKYRWGVLDTELVFTDLYKGNKWRGRHSISGTGSDIDQTRVIAKELPALFRELGIASILDIPCGDFHWMKSIDLGNIAYVGADIVDALVVNNSKQYASDGRSFQKLNLIEDKLPNADLILCRDCLVHLSFRDVFLALHNVCRSQSDYFLTTTFSERAKNCDIITGAWRVLNLECAPFSFPRPIRLINEGCTERNGAYSDKSLALWKISDLRDSLANRRN